MATQKPNGDGCRSEACGMRASSYFLYVGFARAPEAIFARKNLVFARLLHGAHEVLNVPAWIPLRPLVEFLCPPLGLLAGREATDLLLSERQTPRYSSMYSSLAAISSWS